MIVTREWLGGSERIDLGTRDGLRYFARDVMQDYDAADELIERIEQEGCVVININEPAFIERYTKESPP